MKQKVLALFLAVSLFAVFFNIPQKMIEKIRPKRVLDISIPAAKAGPGTGVDSSLPRFYISGPNTGYSSGGVIALSSVEEPAVDFVSYDISGEAKIDVYEASEQDVLDYLIYGKENKQINVNPDTAKMRFAATFYQEINATDQKVLLPIGSKGIWFLNITINGTSNKAFVVRSETGVLVKEGETQFIFWAQDFKTKRSAPEGTIKIYKSLSEKLILV